MLTCDNMGFKMWAVVNMAERMDPVLETKIVATRIGRLHVELRGRGPIVVCWPSLYCDARTLDSLILELARDYRVVVVDGPGHGRSGVSLRPFSLDDSAAAVVEVLDAVSATRVMWIGAAWGGHIGMTVARRYPERLAGLVVLNAPMAPWRPGAVGAWRSCA